MKIVKTTAPKQKPNEDNLGFGKYFTDHMLIMDYTEDKGWHDPQIVPYGSIPMDPATMVLHYGQAIFEGLKAYKGDDGEIRLFRPIANMERVNVSNDRLCIPPIDPEYCVELIAELVKVDSDWIPKASGTSLYIRPFIFASEAALGVHAAIKYTFMVILSPVGAYYKEGINPVKIYVEDNYVRAVRGGIGFAKTPGNYAASLKAQLEAQKKGFSQVLWLDGVERKYIEEVGTMNVFFVIGDEIITPELNGSILAGITRDSSIKVLRDMGKTVVERKLSIDEVIKADEEGKLVEAFGTGTAAVISPIGELHYKDKVIKLSGGNIGETSQKLYDTITGTQNGTVEDKFGWVKLVK